MKFKVMFLSVLFIILSFSFVFAEVPKMINYQGKITTPQGALIDTTVKIAFVIWSDSIGGDSLWGEEQDSIIVEKGIFSVLLGSVNEIPDSVFDGDVKYLGVKVGEDLEMAPRKAIVSVGYAYRSEFADTANYTRTGVPSGVIVMWSGAIGDIPEGWALCDGTNGTPDLRDRFIIGAGGSYSVGNTGGATTHTHGVGSYAVGSHTHTLTTYGMTSGTVTDCYVARREPHTPGDLTTSSTQPSFSGTSGDASSLPPYYALAYIMKL